MNGIWLHEDIPYLQPSNVKDALEALHRHPDVSILAGGTDLIVQIEAGKRQPKAIMDVSRVAGLSDIEVLADSIVYGAMTTHVQMMRHPSTPKPLADACTTIGAIQIQNRGTIGGNIANASPAGDTLPVLLALDAEVEAASLRGRRWIPFRSIYLGYRKLALDADEMITRVKVPFMKDDVIRFRKVGTREAQAISKVVFCGRAKPDRKVLKLVRLAFGCVAPTVIRLSKTEALLEGKSADDRIAREAFESAQDEVQPIDDVRSTAEYRSHVVGALVRNFVMELEGAER